MTKKVDALVIGGGPGGYPAAIRSAQLGKQVLLVEKESIGGECLNWGCIPSKAIIEAADKFHEISHEVPDFGIEVEGVHIDAKKLQEWNQSVTERLVKGVETLLKNNGVEVLRGKARFTKPREVEVSLDSGEKEQIQANDVIIGIGADFATIPATEV
ncbi:FAD-dependent oxidoreductase, partial [Candidatus Thorarchaeota archaeon]